ncbi:hypothetical protein GC197_18340 [bacterium]|nr:hypothetical protein [bacterium]
MTDAKWKTVLKHLEIVNGEDGLHTVDSALLNAAENSLHIKLPDSYRSFCRVFGVGSFGRGDFNIAVPGYNGKANTYSLEYLTDSQRELAGQLGDLGLDPDQISRGIFFAIDMSRSNHFFDPEDVTDPKKHEYAVFSLYRNYEVERTFDSFWDFVTIGCLGEKRNCLLALEDEEGESPQQIFQPMTE